MRPAMDTYTKLGILADAAKYDVACTSSGVARGPQAGKLGIASAAGCCHAVSDNHILCHESPLFVYDCLVGASFHTCRFTA